MSKNSLFGFYYPKNVGQWFFEFPWNVSNWKFWLWHKHETISKNGTSKWTLETRFGFKRITREWLVSPIPAYLEYVTGKKRLFNHLIDFLKQPDFQYDPIEDDIEETRLFK